MGYFVGDKVTYEFYGKIRQGWLMAIHPPKEWSYKKQHKCFKGLTPSWGVKETRVSHYYLIEERQIIETISSDFDGYKKVYKSASELKLLEEAKTRQLSGTK